MKAIKVVLAFTLAVHAHPHASDSHARVVRHAGHLFVSSFPTPTLTAVPTHELPAPSTIPRAAPTMRTEYYGVVEKESPFFVSLSTQPTSRPTMNPIDEALAQGFSLKQVAEYIEIHPELKRLKSAYLMEHPANAKYVSKLLLMLESLYS
jgi:hypothetical protein